MKESRLTPREIAILVGLADGLAVSVIADRLQVSKVTIYRSLFAMKRKKAGSAETSNKELIARSFRDGDIEDGWHLLPSGIVAMSPRAASRKSRGLPPGG